MTIAKAKSRLKTFEINGLCYRICSNCCELKLITEYAKNKNMFLGYGYWCKTCSRKYDRTRGHTEHRMAAVRMRWKKNNQTPEGKKKNTERFKILYWKNPDKPRTRVKTQYLLSHGLLTKQPCEVCRNIKSEAHHFDYNKADQVKWLCRKHHMKLHRHYNE